MSFRKNKDGFEAAVEFSKDPAINLEALRAAQEARQNSPFSSDASPQNLPTLEDILLDPEASYPVIYQDPGPASDVLRKEDLIFCDPERPVVEDVDCPTCTENPAAFVPDWTKKQSGETFFDGTRCVYSAVVDTGVYVKPDEGLKELIKANGIRRLLDVHQRSEVTTAFFYVLEGAEGPDGEICDPTTAADVGSTASTIATLGSLFTTGPAGLIGATVSTTVSSAVMSLAMPAPLMGYCRILKEYDTIISLMDTPLKDDSKAVTIRYHYPDEPALTVKALVSVDVETFERTPRKMIAKPKIDFETPYEVTISGTDYTVIFNDIVRSLKRANQYANEVQQSEGEPRFYVKDEISDQPVVINFAHEAHMLNNFRKEYLTPAIHRALGITLDKLDCLIIQFEEVNGSLKIKEVIGNARGCPKFFFSEVRAQEEVQALFNYTGSRTLGYVAALPDMYYYIQGQDPVVWLEFLTLFTYPGLEIRTPFGLIDLHEEDAGCIADQSLAQLANKLLDLALGVPDMFLNALSDSLCHSREETIEQYQAQQEAMNAAKAEAAAAAPPPPPAKQEGPWTSPESGVTYDTKPDWAEVPVQATKKEQRNASRNDEENPWTSKFEKSLSNKLKDTGGGGLTSESLAKTFTIALVGGIDRAISNKRGTKPALGTPKVKDLKDFQEIIDKVLGGWCGFVEMILQAMDCLLQGMGIDDAKSSIVEAALSSMSPYELQKLTKNLPPETAARLEKVMKDSVGLAADIFMPWDADYTTSQTFNKAEALEQKTETLIQQDKESEDPIYHAQIGDERYLSDFPDKLEEDAEKEVDEDRKKFNDNRMKDASPSGIGTKAGAIQEELISIFKDAIMDVVGVDTLFELLNDIPGFAIVKNFINDACLMPSMPNTNPPMDSFLKTLDIDLCQLGQGKVVDLTFPKFDPPGGQGDEIPIATKTLFKALWEVLEPILIDIATQLLIQAITAIIETVLDAICDLLKSLGQDMAKTQLPLKEAICPDISDEDFADALNNVLQALSNGNPDNDCATELTAADMANFIDAVMVTLSYNQLYNLLLCQATPETLAIVSELAKNLGSECIAEIFGDPKNIVDYFCGLGDLINAEDIFDSFPEHVAMPSTLNVCPPGTQDLIKSLREDLLSDRGLSPEEIQDQLDYLQDQAAKKLKDLLGLLDGPYKDFPALLASGDCPGTGLIKSDPAEWMGFDLMTESIFGPIESGIVWDLLGPDGALNNILSDTAGKRLRSHRFFAGGFFGNPVGSTNILWQFYSDDCINATTVTRDEDGNPVNVTSESPLLGKRIDQYGRTKERQGFFGAAGVAPWAAFDPVGGFPPTVGAYLQKKLKNFELGLVDTENPTTDDNSVEDTAQPKVSFETRHKDPELIQRRDDAIAHNEKVIKDRQTIIAKWAAASSFVDTEALEPYLDMDEWTRWALNDITVRGSGGTIPTIEKRRAIFNDMIQSCNKPLFWDGIPTSTYSAERRSKRILVAGSTTDEDAADGAKYGSASAAATSFAFAPDPITGFFVAAISAAAAAATGAAIAALIAQEKHISINGLLWGLSGWNRGLQVFEADQNIIWTKNTNLAKTFGLSRQMKEWFKEVWEVSYGRAHAYQIWTLPLINPYELSLSYLSYGEKSGANGDIGRPAFGSDLTYDMNLEDDDGNTVAGSKNKYRVMYIEKINPFDDPNLNSGARRIREEQQKLTADNLEVVDVPPNPPITSNKFTRVVFDKEITSIPSQDIEDYVNEFIGSTTAADIDHSWESEFLTKWLAKTVGTAANQTVLANEKILNNNSRKVVSEFFDFINQGFVRRISKRIGEGSGLSTVLVADDDNPDNSSQPIHIPTPPLGDIPMPEAFKFGYDVLAEPVVHMLDPEVYGGTEDTPPYYLEPPTYGGWLGFMQKLLPESDGCEPGRVPIYSLKDVKNASAGLSSKLKDDKRMQFAPTCTKEAPYDALFDKGTAAAMDGVIRVTARVYALDFMLRILPVISQFEINFDDNFDELLQIYLADYTLKRIKLTDIKRWWRPRGRNVLEDPVTGKLIVSGEVVPRKNYYANFLEQAGNLVARKIESGILDPEVDLSPDQKVAYENILETVDQYYSDYDGTEAVLSEEAIVAQDMIKRAINSSATRSSALGRGGTNFDKARAKRIKNGLLYNTLDRTEDDAITLFSIYMKEELNRFKTTLNEMFKPEVDSLDLLFLSHPNFINGAVKDVGPYDVMSDPRDEESFNINLNKFSSEDIDFPGLADTATASRPWPFVLEKYIRIEDKTTEEFLEQPISSKLIDRKGNLQGVINLNDWQSFVDGQLSQNKMELPDKISDYFGPGIKELDDDGAEIIKNTGFKFGLRLSIVLDPDSEFAKPFVDVANAVDRKTHLETKAFNLSSKKGKRILIPLANAELDVSDQLLSSFNIDQYDLPCLINEMIQTIEFRTLFRYVFPYKRYLSLFAIYVGNSFYQSIGNSGAPQDGGDRWVVPGGRAGDLTGFRMWDKQSFENTGRLLMKSFLSLYNTRNKTVEPRDKNTKNSPQTIRELLGDLIPSDLLSGIPWWHRRYQVDRPFDMFGENCSDEDE